MKFSITFLTLCILLISCHTNSEKESQILSFKIADKQNVGLNNNERMIFKVIVEVDSIPNESMMKNTSLYIWENGNKHLKDFTTFLYLPEMNIESSAYGVGEFNESGLVKFVVNKNSLIGTKWFSSEDKEQNEKAPEPELKEYSINLKTTKEGERDVKIIVKTDFPDGTKFLVNVGRTYYQKGKGDAYSGDIYSKDLSVINGEIEVIVSITDTKWYNEHLDLVKALPDDIMPISKTSDKVSVDVMFSPMRNQSKSILKILGSNGEFVSGVGAKKSGKLTTYSVSTEVDIPFQK